MKRFELIYFLWIFFLLVRTGNLSAQSSSIVVGPSSIGPVAEKIPQNQQVKPQPNQTKPAPQSKPAPQTKPSSKQVKPARKATPIKQDKTRPQTQPTPQAEPAPLIRTGLPRTALVMGVGDYGESESDEAKRTIFKGRAIQNLPGITTADLPNMAAKLKSLGFTVTLVANPTRIEAMAAVDTFSARIKATPGVSLFYFSGHGGEAEGQNYLIPRRANIASKADLAQEALSAQRVLNGMEESGAEVNLVFLDCCRQDLAKSVSGAEMAPLRARGSFIGFATRSGDLADPEGQGSPYTRFLLKHMDTPGISILDMYSKVIGDVKAYSKQALGEERRPGSYSELDAPFYFAPVVAKTVPLPISDPVPLQLSGEFIPIGEFASLTGREATFGQSSHEGTLLAVEEINLKGGVLGKQLKLISEDNESKAGNSAIGVRKLITEDRVVAVLGEVASSRSLEAAPICQENSIPMIVPAATNPKVTMIGDFIFRACFIDPFQGEAMADFARTHLKAGRIAILEDVKSDYSKSLAQVFRQQFTKAGTGEITTGQQYSGGDRDFLAQLTAIKASSPQAVFVPGYYPDAANIRIQARRLGLNVPFLGGDGWESSSLIEAGCEAVEGDYFCTHFDVGAVTGTGNAFVQAYRTRFNGKTPDAMAALGYDSVMMLGEAIRQAGTTEGKALRNAISRIRNFGGVMGEIDLDESRNARRAAVILQIRQGKFTYLTTVGR